jgi:hypothetical protein
MVSKNIHAERRALAGIDFVAEELEKIDQYVQTSNSHARPLVWTASRLLRPRLVRLQLPGNSEWIHISSYKGIGAR